jgi:hypothetical protein
MPASSHIDRRPMVRPKLRVELVGVRLNDSVEMPE